VNVELETETTRRKRTVRKAPVVTVVTKISAPVEDVWRVLVAFDRFAQWHPVLSLDAEPGQVVVGAKVPGRASRVGAGEQEVVMTIVAVEAPYRLVWEGGSPDALLGRHSFVLAAQPDGSTELTESEEFSGPAAADLIPELGRLTQEYARYGAALQRRVERPPG
jgi:hypothetical protein